MTNPCKVCGKKDTKKCGKCHMAFYCSVQCQRKDWKSHKQDCGLQRSSTSQSNNTDETPAKAIFGAPFTLEKFVPHLETIKDTTNRCAVGFVSLRMAVLMDKDSSLATCFVFLTSEGKVREHMVCMELGPTDIMQKLVDQFKAHAISMSVEIRYRNPHTMAVIKEGVLLQISAKGYEKKFFFDQTRGGRSESGVLLSVSDAEECNIPLFDTSRIRFH